MADTLKELKDKLQHYKDKLKTESDPNNLKIIEDSIIRLQTEIADYSALQGTPAMKDAGDALDDLTRFGHKKPPNRSLSEDEVINIRNKFRQEKGLPLLQKTKDKLDVDIKKAQLKALKKSSSKPVSLPKVGSNNLRFTLPQFAKENATGIVLVELVAIILLQIHAATTFVTLWNYAFSPNAATTPVNNKTSQVHGSNNASLQSAVPMSVVPSANSGAGILEYWGVPTEYSYIGGFDW